jgi:hypothetical protein
MLVVGPALKSGDLALNPNRRLKLRGTTRVDIGWASMGLTPSLGAVGGGIRRDSRGGLGVSQVPCRYRVLRRAVDYR